MYPGETRQSLVWYRENNNSSMPQKRPFRFHVWWLSCVTWRYIYRDTRKPFLIEMNVLQKCLKKSWVAGSYIYEDGWSLFLICI